MRFSERYRVARQTPDDWFDPMLTDDTPLYVDPFLIFEDSSQLWSDAHDQLIEFFNLVLGLVARAGDNQNSAHWRAASRLMTFPEPAEFCLGLSDGSVRGAGSGAGLRQEMLDACRTTVAAGVMELSHFEELIIFGAGIGADRIGDVVCNVLKRRFIDYTSEVSDRHQISTESVMCRHADWNLEARKWVDRSLPLPLNPYLSNPRRGVLLVPERFLRDIPIVGPENFWEWSYANHNEQIRDELNYEIGRKVDASTIVELAKKRPDLVRNYMEHVEQEPPNAYEFGQDRQFVRWYEEGCAIARALPIAHLPAAKHDFGNFISTIIGHFRHSVEQEGGWSLLWNDDGSPRAEKAVQALFRSVVIHYCRAAEIDLSGEANAGRGPVDFKFSQGWSARALVEVKLTKNSKYWHGLERQLPTYMNAEEIDVGYFVSVSFTDHDLTEDRLERVRRCARIVSSQRNLIMNAIFVDARRPPSASNA